MPVHFSRPIMAAADIDDLFKLVWACVDTKAQWDAYDFQDSSLIAVWHDREHAKATLYNFIMEHHIEFFDLIQRGRDDQTLQQYERDANAKLIPCSVEDDGRKLTVREMYYAPDKKEGDSNETV